MPEHTMGISKILSWGNHVPLERRGEGKRGTIDCTPPPSPKCLLRHLGSNCFYTSLLVVTSTIVNNKVENMCVCCAMARQYKQLPW